MTRSLLICLAGALVGFAGFGVLHFHWPAELVRFAGLLKGGGFSIALMGVAGVRQALKDRQIDAALGDDRAKG